MTEQNKNSQENNDPRSLRTKDPAAKPATENENFDEIPDLDGDGMIGHTGGNYGDTTYTGGSLIHPQPEPLSEAPESSQPDDEKEDLEK